MLKIFTANTPQATALCITGLVIWTLTGVLTTKTLTNSLKESYNKERSRKKC